MNSVSLSLPKMATSFVIRHCSSSGVVYLSRPQRFHSLSSLTAKSRFLKLNNPTRNFLSSSNAPFIVADDDTYGNKQVISITPRLYDYILANVREPQILRQLREETANMRGSQMQVSPDQAQLLAMLVQILGAERCIELGVYTGYSSLAIALALPESGCLLACERDARSLEVAKKYYELAGVSHKVIVKHGLAADVLKSMILNGEACRYDFAFVDAEKRMNQEYFELLLQLVRVGGVIVIDNVLWHGKVADPLENDAKTVSIRNFNRNLMEDKRVSISMPKALRDCATDISVAAFSKKAFILLKGSLTAGALISFAILSTDRVVRDDGTRCTNIKYSNVTTEAIEILKLFRNWRLCLIIPAAWASSVGIGYILDFSFKSRRTRGLVGVGIVPVLGTAIWAGGLANQLNYSFHKLPKRLAGNDFSGPFLQIYRFLQGSSECRISSCLASRQKQGSLAQPADCELGAHNFELSIAGASVYKAVKDDSKSAEDTDTASGLPSPASVKDGYEELDKSAPGTEKDGSLELGANYLVPLKSTKFI
ncbi:hypothetical protein REPUB_Repub12eG0156800 [Reevesia pubescens]